ncbi:Nucleoside diphosphate kinase II, chloroplastic [Asimina triloba]
MGSLSAIGGGSPCICSIPAASSAERNDRNGCYLSYSQNLNMRCRHLAAFRPSPLSYCVPLLVRRAKMRLNKYKTRIFLPQLIASMEEPEETYIMVKPDGVQRGLVGEIISRFERKGFLLKGLKLFQCPKELAQEHYKDLKGKPFFPKLIDYITSGPVVCMGWEGVGVVASARKLIGATNPLQAEPGTIRGDLAIQTGRNVVHGSDSPDNGTREIALWFKEGEIVQWTQAQAPWLSE